MNTKQLFRNFIILFAFSIGVFSILSFTKSSKDTTKDLRFEASLYSDSNLASGNNFADFSDKCGGDKKAKKEKESKDSKCGAGKCGDDKKAKESKEEKCGSGKCGDDKKEGKAKKEMKCGDGKCGDDKKEAKKAAKEKEAKCGTGKCG